MQPPMARRERKMADEVTVTIPDRDQLTQDLAIAITLLDRTKYSDVAKRLAEHSGRLWDDALGVQPPAAMPHDFLTHKDAWRQALVRCRDQRHQHNDDVLYWKHELKAFDAAYAELEAALGVPTVSEGVKR
jgi:hypothetical protein